MARTQAAALVTVQHRQAQLNLRAVALRDFVRIWPLWEGDEQTFGRLIAATIALVGAHHRTSAALAAAYYQTFRAAEAPGGRAAPRLVQLDPQAVAASLYVTGRVMTAKAILAGASPQAAMQTALIRTSGAVTRHVMAGGRGTLVASTTADDRSVGWQRITSADPCDFCASMEGAISTEDFEAHDHCACVAEPVFS